MASFSGVTFVLFCCFRLYDFVEAAALRSIVLRYAGAPIATHACFFLFSYCFLEMSLFPSTFSTIAVFSLYGEYVCVCESVVIRFILDVSFLWTYQSGSHGRKATHDLFSTFLLRCLPYFFSREG